MVIHFSFCFTDCHVIRTFSLSHTEQVIQLSRPLIPDGSPTKTLGLVDPQGLSDTEPSDIRPDFALLDSISQQLLYLGSKHGHTS